MTKKFIADTIMVVMMPLALTAMAWLALKVPRTRRMESALADLDLLKYKKSLIAGSVVVGILAVVCGATAGTRIIEALANNEEALRRVYQGLLGILVISLIILFPTAKTRIVACGSLALSIVLWLFWTNWLTASILGLVICAVVVAVWQPRLRFAYLFVIILVVMGVYDVTQVLITKEMQEMVFTVIDATLPLMVVVPGELGLNATPESGLGLGDIVASGLLLVAAARISQRSGRVSIFLGGLVGFILADLAIIWVGRMTKHFQPASVYMVAGIALGVWLAAVLNGRQSELLRSQDNAPSLQD